MKITISFFAAVILLFTVEASAQTLPNGGFENFTGGNPDGWVTSNVGVLGVYPIIQSPDAHTGASAVRGDVIATFSGDTLGPLLLVGTGDIFRNTPGVPFTFAGGALKFWYKFVSTSVDLLSVDLELMRKGETLGSAFVDLGAAPNYQQYALAVNAGNGATPDSVRVQFSISNPDSFTGSVGSTFFIDDVSFEDFNQAVESADVSGTALSQNYPNPCNPSTSIPLALSERSAVNITLYNASGESVRTLVDEVMNPGQHMIKANLNGLASGVYTYELKAGANTLRKRLILAK